MKQSKRAFALLLCVAMVLSMCMAFAGATEKREKIIGSGTPSESVTFTVSTYDQKVKLKLTQTKGTATMWSGDSREEYGRYTVIYTDKNGNSKTTSFTGKNKTITLNMNQAYKVSITAYSREDLGKCIRRIIPRTHGVEDMFIEWSKAPQWTATAKNALLWQ